MSEVFNYIVRHTGCGKLAGWFSTSEDLDAMLDRDPVGVSNVAVAIVAEHNVTCNGNVNYTIERVDELDAAVVRTLPGSRSEFNRDAEQTRRN